MHTPNTYDEHRNPDGPDCRGLAMRNAKTQPAKNQVSHALSRRPPSRASEASVSAVPDFAWMAPHLQRVLDTRGIDPIIIDPAMVYEAGGDVFRFVDDVNEGAIRIVGCIARDRA